jgi:hypothetical protein
MCLFGDDSSIYLGGSGHILERLKASLVRYLKQEKRQKALIALAIATLGIGLSPAAFAQTGNEPRPQTEAALGCLLGMAPDGCQTAFANARSAWFRTTYCTVQYIHRWLPVLNICPRVVP